MRLLILALIGALFVVFQTKNAFACSDSESCIRQLNEKIIHIERKISQLEAENRALSSRIAQALNASNAIRYTIIGQGQRCPSGWRRLGIIGVIMLNKDYGNNVGVGGAFNSGWTWTHPTLCGR